MAASVEDYDRLISGTLQHYVDLSEKIGGIVKDQADLVQAAFQAQREFLLKASQCKKPDDNILQALLQPTSEKIIATQNIREKNRSSEYFTHLSAVSEAISALGWVVISPDPSKYAKELHASGAYYGNKVITSYKDKNSLHSEWAKTWLDVLNELHSFIREHHRCGVSWNPKGMAADKTNESISSKGGVPPPPPPPPPPELFGDVSSEFSALSTEPSDARAALFKEINQGADITKCLKKVDKEKQQQKSPAVRSQAVKSAPILPAVQKVKTPDPVFTLDGRKWRVEFQDTKELDICEASMNQVVAVYKCHKTVVRVLNKVNCITFDSCKRCDLIFNDVISQVEIINCQQVRMQVVERVPMITIDGSDGVQIYLAKSDPVMQIVSSKSSEINICVPKDEDFVEYPIPEQFKTTITPKGLKTVPIEKN